MFSIEIKKHDKNNHNRILNQLQVKILVNAIATLTNKDKELVGFYDALLHQFELLYK